MARNQKTFATAYWLAPRAILTLAAVALWVWAAFSWVAALRQGIHPSLMEWAWLIFGPIWLVVLIVRLIVELRSRDAQGS